MLDTLSSTPGQIIAGGVAASVPIQVANPVDQHSLIGTVVSVVVPFVLSALSQLVLTLIKKKYGANQVTTSEN